MGIYDTKTLRKYCESHKGDILDVGYLLKNEFSYVIPGSFRKYVSRLVEEGILYPIEKGIYTIGVIDEKEIDKVIYKHYTNMSLGLPLGEGLLFARGIIEKMPEKIEIITSLTNGNRNIRNFKIIETSEVIAGVSSIFIEMVELYRLITKTYLEAEPKADALFLLNRYCDMFNTLSVTPVEPAFRLYSRIDILSLANYLDKLHISNRVMEVYEEYTELYCSR
jgi:hypothetical protein